MGKIFVDLRDMTASEIIEFVDWRTSGTIYVSPKNKKSVIAHALRIAEKDGFEVRGTKVKMDIDDCPKRLIKESVPVSEMSASKIVEAVFQRTGLWINYSLKSKRSIVKKAEEILSLEGYAVA